jgi:glycosyltransferase involved in cell wall biosynthesis
MALSICIIQPSLDAVSETFIRAHAERLPGKVTVVHAPGTLIPRIDGEPVLSQALPSRAMRKLGRWLLSRPWDWEYTAGFIEAFRRCDADVVLAEYGPTGVAVRDACSLANVPLVVHFHGYDASRFDILERFKLGYQALFQDATTLVTVSTKMHQRLLALGASPARTFLNVYGIDCSKFAGARPEQAKPTFLAVGRFVEKKGPHLTLLAFAEVLRRVPEVRLRMIGEGALLGPCRDLAGALGIRHAVDFLGAQPHDVVAREMKNARAFVQHSIEALDGDSEGTPLAVLEAGACSLPVVSTNHAGIPDVVIDGETGFIVSERDVISMADRMTRLAHDAELASEFGVAARKRVSTEFTIEKSISTLSGILVKAVNTRNDTLAGRH